jgi:cell wall-associated NlpC family hydrolase
MLRRLGIVVVLGCVFVCAAGAATANWAAPQIKAVTKVGVLGTSVASFAPASPLTQSQLAAAISTTDSLQHPAAPQPEPVVVTSTVGPGAIVAGPVPVEIAASGRDVQQVSFAVDGVGMPAQDEPPYVFEFDTGALTDGVHELAANVAFVDGGYAIATWEVTVSNTPGTVLTPTGDPVTLPIAKSWLPGAGSAPTTPLHTLYRAVSPAKAVTVKQLDAALVAYLGLGAAAREIQSTLKTAGLQPPANTGTEAVARMLGLRLNHPAGQDFLEILPNQAVTRAEAAYSFAQVLQLSDEATQAVRQAADTFTLPQFTAWQQQILTTAVRYVGYPYVWGGTDPTPETEFGVRSAGGFDCSGFVWRVYKLTAYPDEGDLASVLRGRTTYVMSGEVPRSQRITAAKLQPGDVMFFGAKGPKSSPTIVDHTAIYLGNGWFVQSSGEGVTLLPFAGWYTQRFAWARRPLREAGLSG